MGWRLSRRGQLWVLVGAAALTNAPYYVIQGAIATGHDPSLFPDWFWNTDYICWVLRSFIESAVVVFLFTTAPSTKWQAAFLGLLKIFLIGLIFFTVGPVVIIMSQKIPLKSLPDWLVLAWSYGIAMYAPAAIGAAGYAYRVQPDRTETGATGEAQRKIAEMHAEIERMHSDAQVMQHRIDTMHSDADLMQRKNDEMHAEVERVHSDAQIMQQKLDAAHSAITAADAWNLQPATERIKQIASRTNGDCPDPGVLAEMFGVHRSTVTRAIAAVRDAEPAGDA